MFNIALINVNLIVIKDNKIIFMKIPKTIKIKKCRLCKNTKLKQIYNFGNHYVSNFVSKASKTSIIINKNFIKTLPEMSWIENRLTTVYLHSLVAKDH